MGKDIKIPAVNGKAREIFKNAFKRFYKFIDFDDARFLQGLNDLHYQIEMISNEIIAECAEEKLKTNNVKQ